MEAVPAQEPKSQLERVLLDPELDLLFRNASLLATKNKEARKKRSEKSLIDTIAADPDLDTLFRNATILASKEKAAKPRRSRLVNTAILAASLAAVTPGSLTVDVDPIIRSVASAAVAKARTIEIPDVVYPDNIFPISSPIPSSTPTEAPTPKPTPEPTLEPTPTPTEYPKALVEKEIGNRNAAEFFLGDLVKQFKEKRAERLKNDPEFAKRIQKEFLNSDRINILYLGVDQIRGRDDFNNERLGRADSIIVISFDPHTGKITAISIPRDKYAPEMKQYVYDPKINTMTMINAMPEGGNVDANKLVKRIIENATGIPIDMIIKTSVDFIRGADGIPGIFDELFPDGLEINVPNEVVDPDMPVADGKKGLMFKKGVQKMSGEKIMRYATERRVDLDFGRSDRQRQVIQASMMALFPRIMDDLKKGDTKTLDKLVSTLEKQKESFNLFYDVDLIGIVKTMRDNLKSLRSTPKGIVVLGVLYTNSKGLVDKIRNNPGEMFTSFGLGYGNTPYSLVGRGDGGTTLIFPGQRTNDPPLLQWDPLRKIVFELLK